MLSTRHGTHGTGQNVSNIVKNVTILEFHDHIWNHYEKYIQMSTNMPGIGLVIYELPDTI